MPETSCGESRGSQESATSSYTISNSSMIELVRRLNGASFERFEDDLPQMAENAPNVTLSQKRKSISSRGLAIRSRISSPNLAGLFGQKEKRASKKEKHRWSFSGPEPEAAESSDTLHVTDNPKGIEITIEAPWKPTRKPPASDLSLVPVQTGEIVKSEEKGKESEREKKKKKEKKGETTEAAPNGEGESESYEVLSERGGARKKKEAIRNPEESAEVANPGVPVGHSACEEKGTSKVPKEEDHKEQNTLRENIPPQDKSPKAEKHPNQSISRDDSAGMTWMRKSTSSLFPSVARDGATTLPAFQRWSCLLNSNLDTSSMFASRDENYNTVTGAALSHDIEPQPNGGGPEGGSGGRWRRLVGRLPWGRKSSRVTEAPLCTSAPVSRVDHVTNPTPEVRGRPPLLRGHPMVSGEVAVNQAAAAPKEEVASLAVPVLGNFSEREAARKRASLEGKSKSARPKSEKHKNGSRPEKRKKAKAKKRESLVC